MQRIFPGEKSERVYFLANVCHVCKESKTPYTCQVCQMVFYCSPEHRRENWPDHSRLCWALSKICREEKVERIFETLNGLDFTGFRHGIANKCVRLLGRPLQGWELEIIYHPRICGVCKETNWKRLEPCKGCGVVFTCDKRHFPPRHDEWCKTLKTYSDLIRIRNGRDSIRNDSKIFKNEFKIKKNDQMTMSKVLNDFLRQKNPDSEDFEVRKSLASELLTYPLTVLDSLRQIQAENQKEINILFVGAEREAEVEPTHKWENYLFHQLPATENLNLFFLGPEIGEEWENHQTNLCQACRDKNKKLRFEFVKEAFYHDHSFRLMRKNLDLICAFNSGMYREIGFDGEDSWKETIIHLFTRQKAPVLITEYTRFEVQKDLEKLKRLCGNLKCISPLRQNPFASLKPGLNLISENEVPVIFKNYFSVMVKPKTNEEKGEEKSSFSSSPSR